MSAACAQEIITRLALAHRACSRAFFRFAVSVHQICVRYSFIRPVDWVRDFVRSGQAAKPTYVFVFVHFVLRRAA